MQNEELYRLENEAEALLERYMDVYDHAPVGYFTLDPSGTILRANLTGSCLLGVPRSHLIGTSLREHIADGSLKSFDALFNT
jgi:PAS domain-containing protein